jgi:hypothetical protein
MSRILNSKKLYYVLIAAGAIFYIMHLLVILESKAGICIEIRSPSGRSTKRDAIIGIEEDGVKKSVYVKINYTEDLKPGSSVLLAKKIIGYDLEKQTSASLEDGKLLFYGQTSRVTPICEMPLGARLSVVVEQDNVLKSYSFEDRYYYVILDKTKPATLNFTCEGYNQKQLTLELDTHLQSSVFSAKCVFHEGSGLEYIRMNLDSIARTQVQE